MKRVGLISDTHGYFGPELKDFLRDVDVVLHCGDWGSIHTFEQVIAFKPVIGVYGNCDDQEIRMEVPLYQHFKLEDLDCLMIHIGGFPGRYDYKAYQLINQIRPDLFFCGHSHILRVMNDSHFTKRESTTKGTFSQDSVSDSSEKGASNEGKLPNGSKKDFRNEGKLPNGSKKDFRNEGKLPDGSEMESTEKNIRKMLVMNPGACGIMGFHNVRTALRFRIEGRQISDLELGQWPR
ncbi:MAG: metallophosphoesterase family protein [Bacteroidales bacterium]|nr:metallophosphoesterase family protein [Bacteroidales bacterium]